jgi:hypothetical protein
MTVPDGFFPMLQNGGLYVMAAFICLVLVFAPLIYIAVLSSGSAHNRLVEIIKAFTGLVAAYRKPKTRRK